MLQEEMINPPNFTYLRRVQDDVKDWEARGVKETNIREDPFIVLNQQYWFFVEILLQFLQHLYMVQIKHLGGYNFHRNALAIHSSSCVRRILKYVTRINIVMREPQRYILAHRPLVAVEEEEVVVKEVVAVVEHAVAVAEHVVAAKFNL